MSEQKKDECCSSGSGSGCCGGMKKLIFMAVLGLVVFTCGYIIGQGKCPMSSSGSGKMCPLLLSK